MSKLVYNLYLDESGDFDRDLTKNYKKECLVGGYLVRGERVLPENEMGKLHLSAAKKVPCLTALPDAEIKRYICHATELADKLGLQAKADVEYELLKTIVGLDIQLIIFENYLKSRIVDSTTTYINILADGIIQLMVKLSLKHPGDKVELNVIAGGRRDMTATGSDVYTSEKDVEKRLNERLSLLRLRSYSLLKTVELKSFVYKDDKRCEYLIACDYICNFYFTRENPIFNKCTASGKTYAEELLPYYKAENIFSLMGHAEREEMLYELSSGNFAGLLFAAASGMLSEENANYVKNAFYTIERNSIALQLKNLSNYYNEVIGNHRDIELGNRVLKFGEELLEGLKKIDKSDVRFEMEMILYRLALLNHEGRLSEMVAYFEKGKNCLRELLKYSENMDVASMFYNRYAVYLFDTLQPEKANELLEHIIKQYEAYSLIGDELVNGPLPEELKGSANHLMNSDQLGKLLGTQTMVVSYLLKRGEFSYEDAVQINERALENFESERDRRFQYQRRMIIECYAGHYDDALKYLLLASGMNNVEDLCRSSQNEFVLCHISLFLKTFSEKNDDVVKQLIKYMTNQSSSYLKKGYPNFITAANMADALAKIPKTERNQIVRYYSESCKQSVEDTPIFLFLKVTSLCAWASYCWDYDKAAADGLISEIESRCKEIISIGISPEITKLMSDFCNGDAGTIDRCIALAAIRHY